MKYEYQIEGKKNGQGHWEVWYRTTDEASTFMIAKQYKADGHSVRIELV